MAIKSEGSADGGSTAGSHEVNTMSTSPVATAPEPFSTARSPASMVNVTGAMVPPIVSPSCTAMAPESGIVMVFRCRARVVTESWRLDPSGSLNRRTRVSWPSAVM